MTTTFWQKTHTSRENREREGCVWCRTIEWQGLRHRFIFFRRKRWKEWVSKPKLKFLEDFFFIILFSFQEGRKKFIQFFFFIHPSSTIHGSLMWVHIKIWLRVSVIFSCSYRTVNHLINSHSHHTIIKPENFHCLGSSSIPRSEEAGDWAGAAEMKRKQMYT